MFRSIMYPSGVKVYMAASLLRTILTFSFLLRFVIARRTPRHLYPQYSQLFLIMLAFKFLALCAFLQAAVALPAVKIPQLNSIPAEAATLAHDADRDVFIAYDASGQIIGELPATSAASDLEKRDPGTCANISGDDIQRRKYCLTRPASTDISNSAWLAAPPRLCRQRKMALRLAFHRR